MNLEDTCDGGDETFRGDQDGQNIGEFDMHDIMEAAEKGGVCISADAFQRLVFRKRTNESKSTLDDPIS